MATERKVNVQQGDGSKAAERPAPAAPPAPERRGEMAPYGWDPFRGFWEDFGQLVQRFFRGPFPGPWEGGGRGWRWGGLDVEETDDAVVVRADAPGFEPGDFDIQVRVDRLVMRAAHKAEGEKERGAREWRRQEFYQAVSLPPGT